MHELYELKEKLLKELGDYSENGKFSKEDAENIKNLSGAIDHLCNIVMDMESEYSNEYGGNSNARGGGGNRGGGGRSNRGGGSSYARGGQGRRGNVRRDSMGRYSREGGYSYDEAIDDMTMTIRENMQELPENLKRDARRFLKKLEQEM